MNKFFAKLLLKAISLTNKEQLRIIFGDNFVDGSSSTSSWNFVAMDILGKYFAKADFKVYVRDEDGVLIPLKNHPINKLFKKPNSIQTFWEIKYNWAFHLGIYGNSYLLKLRDKLGIPVALVQLKPFNVKPYIENNKLKEYHYLFNGETIILKIQDIIHLKYPNPDDPLNGRPIIQNILDQIEVDKLQTKYQKQFYKSGGFLGQTFVAHKELSKTTFERLQQELTKKYGGGYENAYKVAVLEMVEPVKHAYSIKDMELTSQRELARDEILSAFQIPKILAGIGENINRATAEASIFQYTSGVVDPLCYLFDEILTNSFMNDFEGGENLVIEHDPLAPKDVEANIRYYQEGLTNGWLTLNDVRTSENLPKFDYPEAEVPIIAVNRMPITNWSNNRMGNIVDNQNSMENNSMQVKASPKVQTLIFYKEYFTLEEARKWVLEYGFQDNGVDETENTYRFRQRDPNDFIPDSFRTITLTEGVKAVVGKLKDDNQNYSTIDYLKYCYFLLFLSSNKNKEFNNE